MKRAYGKFPRGGMAKAPSADRLIIDIKGRHTLEQLSLELMKAIARLQDCGAHGIETCSIYLKPLDEKGGHITLYDKRDVAITRLAITDKEEPPYRPD